LSVGSVIKNNDMIPTIEEYQKAKEITMAYDREQERIQNLNIEAFRSDLREYFKTHLIDRTYKLESFELSGNDIIPRIPSLEENYEGGNNEDIKKLCEKHNVDFKIVYWCYHK